MLNNRNEIFCQFYSYLKKKHLKMLWPARRPYSQGETQRADSSCDSDLQVFIGSSNHLL